MLNLMLAATPLLVDLGNLQAWQAFAALIGVLGLSPAPWILGLALGRIQFTKTARLDHDRLVEALVASHVAAIAELNKHHDDLDTQQTERYNELKESRDYYREARLQEATRANRATDQLAEVATEASKIATTALGAIEDARGKA